MDADSKTASDDVRELLHRGVETATLGSFASVHQSNVHQVHHEQLKISKQVSK